MHRSVREAFRQMRRTPYQALGAILVLFITFFVGYVFSFVVFGSEQVIRYFETRPQVTAFFKNTTSDEDIQAIAEEMRSKPYVAEVKMVSKNEALALYKEENQEDPLLLELVTADILPASIEVSGKDITALDQIQRDVQEHQDKIDEVVYQKSIVDSLAKWTQTIRYIGIAAIVVLAITSLIIVMIIISMKVAMKRQEIGIMRLLGATSWYIDAPFMIEGMWYGTVSAVLAWGIVALSFLYATPWILDFFGEIQALPTSWIFYVLQLAGGVLFGALIGALASILALRRFIK